MAKASRAGKTVKSETAEWGDIIRQQGEAREREQKKRIAQLKKDLPKQIRGLLKLDNEVLLDTLLNAYVKQSGIDPREGEIWTKLYGKAREELLYRMAA